MARTIRSKAGMDTKVSFDGQASNHRKTGMNTRSTTKEETEQPRDSSGSDSRTNKTGDAEQLESLYKDETFHQTSHEQIGYSDQENTSSVQQATEENYSEEVTDQDSYSEEFSDYSHKSNEVNDENYDIEVRYPKNVNAASLHRKPLEHSISSDDSDYTEEKSSGRKQSCTAKDFAFVVALLACLIAAAVHFESISSTNSVEVPPPVLLSPEEKMNDELKKLKSQFGQQEKLWRIVRAATLRHAFSKDNKQPSVIMIASLKKAASTREILAKEIAKLYSISCNDVEPTVVSGGELVDLSHESAKLKLDQMILDGFQNHSCAAIVSNFEKLPPASSTVFYQFCENDNAPYKNVIILFTLELSDRQWMAKGGYDMLLEGYAPEPKLWDTIVEEYIQHSLQTRDLSRIMTVDMIGGLLTRITPAVIWIDS